jgi:hypothetical protein
MKSNLFSPALFSTGALCVALFLIVSGCSRSSSGINAGDSAREVNAAFEKQKNLTGGTDKILQEVSQIPSKEQLSTAPERDAFGFYILERQKDGPYKFVVSPQPNSTTGEFAPSNTLRVALVTYNKVDDGPYKIVEKNTTIPGFRLDADVVLIDHTIPAVVLRKTFRGAKPAAMSANSNHSSIKAGDSEIVGKKPLEDIQKFLDTLPYKK